MFLCTAEPVDGVVRPANDQANSFDECTYGRINGEPFPILEFIRASSLHVGAAAAAAALRRDLVDTGRLPGTRSTRRTRWPRHARNQSPGHVTCLESDSPAGRGALLALGVGALVPAIVAVTLGAG